MRTDLELRVIGLAAVLVTALFMGTGGCSSSDDSDEPEQEAGVDAAVPEATPEDDGGDDGGEQTYEQCAAMCATQHMAGKQAQDAVDSCWTMHCNDVCVGDGGTFTPPDAGDGGVPSCGTPDQPVDTGNGTCNLCTTDWCCTEYETCEGLADCDAYGVCMDGCDALDEN